MLSHYREVYAAAHAAGIEAIGTLSPSDHEPGNVGWGWVRIGPGNKGFGRWLLREHLAGRSHRRRPSAVAGDPDHQHGAADEVRQGLRGSRPRK